MDSPHILWKPRSESPILSVDAIHIWCASLQRSVSEVEQLAASLSKDERDRASRFHFPHHQRRFIVARGLLRHLLADYLAVSPKEIEFSYLQRGKPELAGDRHLQFNLSHSEELVVYAFCLSHPVGIDVEYLRSTPDLEPIAARFFTKWEYDELRSLPPAERTSAFFRCWTRKEAYLKACGDGIGGGLDQIEVSLTPEAQIRQIHNSVLTDRDWDLQNLAPAVGYVGAIAAQASNLHLHCWHLHSNSSC
ncbi:4'-phosphopantetheinyl transferase family protein [Merismopedia glauca]|uniref:4'-phosphopantetheinyl transferase family protein n=1 Tax=Merismopedia glauca TaxID=292586 RepID=UPI001FE64208|nr:4'-phosphopantetheinyl transferase superfamily protein [Merismopedia glauca]